MVLYASQPMPMMIHAGFVVREADPFLRDLNPVSK
jgi:hypothetical protein